MIPPLSPESHLEWRVRLMGAGALIALVGIYFDVSWLIWVAIGVLAVGLLMRFVGREGDGADDAEVDSEEQGSGT